MRRFAILFLLFSLLVPCRAQENAEPPAGSASPREGAPDDRAARADEILRLLAETAEKFEADAARPPRGPEELRRYLGASFDFRDPWGNPFRIDGTSGVVLSCGPDGIADMTREAALRDDLAVRYRDAGLDPKIAQLRAIAHPLRDAIVAYRAEATREIAALADLERRHFTGAVALRDPWGRPFSLDLENKRLLAGAPAGDGMPEAAAETFAFSYDTASDELKSLAALARLRALAGSLETLLRSGGQAPGRIEELLAACGETAEAALLDPWGNPYRLDTSESILRSAGPDGRFDPREPGPPSDDLRAGYAPDAALREAARETARSLVDALGRAALLHRVFEGGPPQGEFDLRAAGRLPEGFPALDPYGAPWRIDAERGVASCAGPDGAHGTADDLRYDFSAPPAADAASAARAGAEHLADALARFEKEGKTKAVSLLDLVSRHAPTVFRMRDPWGARFLLEHDLRHVYSPGPDGAHTLSPRDATWDDDVTAETRLSKAEPAGKKGKETGKEKGKKKPEAGKKRRERGGAR